MHFCTCPRAAPVAEAFRTQTFPESHICLGIQMLGDLSVISSACRIAHGQGMLLPIAPYKHKSQHAELEGKVV